MDENGTENPIADELFDGQPVLEELKKISSELSRLNAHPLLAERPSKAKILSFEFFKGVFLGFGSFVGATIVVSILVYLLSNIEFVPIIGDVVKKILIEIKH